MSNILTGFNMQGNDPIDNRIVSPSKFETLEEYLQRVPIQKRYYGLSFYALDENNELRHYTFQTSLIEPTIDDDEEEIERLDKELQEHVKNKEIHKTSEEIRSEIVDADIPDTIARVQWTLDKIEEAVNTVMGDIVDGASDEYNTLKKIQDKIVELRTEMESQLYGDDGGEVLKTLEQALKFLNQYKDFIVDIPDNYVNKQDIVDNLNTDDPTKVLSARQGKVLSETLTNYFDSAMASIRAETNRATNAENRIEDKLDSEIDRSTAEDIRIQSELDAEEDRAQSEEKRIENKLDAEIERSTTKDTELGNQIIAETNRAEGEEQRIETKLDNEITRSTAKDDEHDDRIKALEGDTHVQNTDIGTTSQTFQLQLSKPGNKIKNEDAAVSVRNAADTDYANFIAKNATFKGDLIVEGQSFVTEAETVEIKDNILLLNKGEAGSGVTKGIAGLQIDRGTEPDFQILFVESDRRFKAGEEGNLQCLALRDDDGNMLDGMFTTWDSATHRLKTTNIIPSTRKLFFNTNANSLGFASHTYDSSYSAESFTFTNALGSLFFSAGESNLNLDTDKTYFRFYKNLMIPSSIISSGTSISLLNNSGATIATFGSPSTINSSLNVANQVIIKGGSDTKLKMQSADADNINLIESQNSSGTVLSKLGYYGTFWGIDNKKIATEEFANNKFLPLAGGTMTGVILMNNNVVIQSKNSSGTAKRLIEKGSDNVTYIGDSDGHTFLYSDAADIIHVRNGTNYTIYDSYNFNPGNYLPLTGGALTGQLTIKQSVDIKLRLQSTDADNYCIIQAINAQASQLGVFGYAGDKWAIGHGGTYYEIWDKFNLSDPATLSGNNTFTGNNTFQALYVGPSYTSDDLSLVPANGIYSRGIIYIENGIGFRNSIWTNDLTPNKHYSGYLQVLDAYDASSAGGPTNYGTVLQVNSRNTHWANQLWFPGGAEASKNGLYYRHMAYNETTYGEWIKLATTSDLGNYLPLSGGTISSSKSNPLIINSTHVSQSSINFSRGGVNKGTVGFYENLGSFLQNVTGETLAVKSDGAYYGVNNNSLRKLVTVTDLNNYLPLTGGNLTGELSIKSSGSNLLILDSSSSTESVIHFLRSSTSKGAVGYYDNIGAFIYNFPSNTYLFVKDDGKPYVGTKTNYKKILTETDITGYATQSWVNNQGYLTSHQTIYNLTFQAGTFAAKTFDPNGAAATVNIPTNTSHLTNDSGFITSSALSGYATQSWANSQFASLALYNTTRSYSTIRTTGNEICIGNTAATSASNLMLVNYRVPSGCTYAPASWVWRAGSSSSYAAGYWGNLYMNDNLVATQTWSNSQYPLKTGTGASGTWDINISGNASTASAASKLGSTTIGGSAKPIYLSSGTPTACSATVGSATVPVYMNAGTITQCSTTLGVSITGNAATATTASNSNNLGGYAAATYVKSTSTTKVQDIQVVTTAGSTTGVLYVVLES